MADVEDNTISTPPTAEPAVSPPAASPDATEANEPPAPKTSGTPSEFIPLVTVVGFHHARGPEVETWFGAPDGSDPAIDNDWSLLPFMALSDGAHATEEDFSYFTLLRPATGSEPATSLFGISCTRQLDSTQLINRPADVTRSTVQKAVVVIAESPQYFGMLRERLSVVTQAWFAQREFTDIEILRRFQESLAEEKERGLLQEEQDRDQYLGMSLRELVREFKWQTLVLLKCCLLQPKMLFFGSRCERLCMMQFSLISLIPGLIRNLQDCADPELNAYEGKLSTPTTLKTSDRNSLLTYMGLPLQVFGKGSLFGPYTPLQQLDILADHGTKSYIVGSTNSLLLQQKDRYSDILIHLDESSVNITSTSLKQALVLSAADRRWIDYLTQEVNDTWDEANPGRPKTMGYVGSEEFIRLQFEEYILSLISSYKYHVYLQANQNNPKALLPNIEYDPALDFGTDFIDYWTRTENHRMWNTHTDSHLFDVVEPKHPCAGGMTIDDVQRRIAQQVQDLHLDERFAQGREVLGRNFAAGRDKASTMFNKLYADMETYREAQRQRAKEQQQAQGSAQGSPIASEHGSTWGNGSGVDVSKAQSNVQSAGAKAGAYVGSWVSWAGEKRKGWGSGWGKKSDKNGSTTPGPLSPRDSLAGEKEGRFSGSSFFGRSSSNRDLKEKSRDGGNGSDPDDGYRPATGASFGESIFSAAGTTESDPASPRKGRTASRDDGDDIVLQVRDVTPAQELPMISTPSLPPPKDELELVKEDKTADKGPEVEEKKGLGIEEPAKEESKQSDVGEEVKPTVEPKEEKVETEKNEAPQTETPAAKLAESDEKDAEDKTAATTDDAEVADVKDDVEKSSETKAPAAGEEEEEKVEAEEDKKDKAEDSVVPEVPAASSAEEAKGKEEGEEAKAEKSNEATADETAK